MIAFLRRLFGTPWAEIVRTHEDGGGGTVAVLDCGHEVYADYHTPRFICPLCWLRRYAA